MVKSSKIGKVREFKFISNIPKEAGRSISIEFFSGKMLLLCEFALYEILKDDFRLVKFAPDNSKRDPNICYGCQGKGFTGSPCHMCEGTGKVNNDCGGCKGKGFTGNPGVKCCICKGSGKSH